MELYFLDYFLNMNILIVYGNYKRLTPELCPVE